MLATRDHPRGCGEHAEYSLAVNSHVGSSPRMRGALSPSSSASAIPWIIPADAGSTKSPNTAFLSCRDHPRGCGEHASMTYEGARVQGSSPRMRGAQDQDAPNQAKPGIIPADAGSTAGGWSAAPGRRDHPRGCGEHSPSSSSLMRASGSSPRMRGAQPTTIQAVGG